VSITREVIEMIKYKPDTLFTKEVLQYISPVLNSIINKYLLDEILIEKTLGWDPISGYIITAIKTDNKNKNAYRFIVTESLILDAYCLESILTLRINKIFDKLEVQS
jgi:ABC-type antimicrobial peptide transport system permease subunit